MGIDISALYFLSLGFRSLLSSTRRCPAPSAFLISLFISIPAVLVLSEHESICRDSTPSIICQVEEMKLKVTRLESSLEAITRSLNAKDAYLKEKDKQIEEMTERIHFLQNSIVNIKKSQDDSSYYEERIRQLEEEVRFLWAESRKNNFNIHILEANAHESEEKLEELTSQVAKMEDIVTEQWIQIRQLEQALQITEIKRMESTRCIFLKFFRDFQVHQLSKLIMLDPSVFGSDSVLGSCTALALDQLKRIMSTIQKCHHQLQHTVKQTMERNELTAALANKEVVFFVASALVIFPIMSAWILCTSCFSSSVDQSEIHMSENKKMKREY